MAAFADARILTIFRDQAGVITRAQALALGFTDRQISARLRSGSWTQLRRGVYRNALFQQSAEMHVHALTLGGRGYVSHRHAARLHRLDPVLMRSSEITVGRNIHDHYPGVIVHQSTQVRETDIQYIDSFPVSTVERTIMDVAAVEHRLWKVLALIDSAREQGKTDPERLELCLERHAKRGRDGTAAFRRALKLIARDERPAASPFSRDVAGSLHARGLPYPKLEEEIRASTGELIARVDLSFDVAVLMFLDGFRYHGQRRRQTNRDRRQRQVLRSMGFTVLEFTYDQWLRDPAFVIGQTLDAVSRAPRRSVA